MSSAEIMRSQPGSVEREGTDGGQSRSNTAQESGELSSRSSRLSSGPRAAAKRLSMSTSTSKDVKEKKLDTIAGTEIL